MPKLPAVRRDMVYQTGTIRSLLTGVYEGDLPFAELAHYGDFGLGTFDAVNGEMVALDGHFFRIDAQGHSHPVSPAEKSPFAVVTHFNGSIDRTLATTVGLEALQQSVRREFESDNIIYAVRIHGRFDLLEARSEHPQPEGHHPLRETIGEVQTKLRYEDLTGTMVGFWFPRHMSAINVPGFHFHFLDDDHRIGGHVFDLRLRQGNLKLMPSFDFGMHLLHTPLFESIDLSLDDAAATREVEQAPQG